jgi:hypothetical protein
MVEINSHAITDAAVTRGLGEGVVEGSIDCGDFGDDANRTQGGHA